MHISTCHTKTHQNHKIVKFHQNRATSIKLIISNVKTIHKSHQILGRGRERPVTND